MLLRSCLSRGMTAVLAVMLLSLPDTAMGALAPQYYQEAREQAPHHLQLRIDEVRLLRGRKLANCEVSATVLRDFRGALAAGTLLRFALNCTAQGVRPMPGPNAWHAYDTLKAAGFAEGFFRGADGRFAPAYGALAIVADAREWPWCEAGSGRCDLPPPEPPQVLECGMPGPGGTGRETRGGWIIRIADHAMSFWSDIAHLSAGDGRHWMPHYWEPLRTPVPLQIEGDRYLQVSHLYTEGGESLLMTREFSYDRSTGRFSERLVRPDGGLEAEAEGTCRPIADPLEPAAAGAVSI